MIAVLLAFGSFAAAFLVHLIIWRIAVPAAALRVAAAIYAVFLVAAASAALAWAPGFGLDDGAYFAVLYGAIALCYLLTYTGIEADSPTLSIVTALAQGGERGVSAAEMAAFIRRRPFVRSRLLQLYRDGVVVERDGHITASRHVSFVFALSEFYRRLMGRTAKGG